jgi:predicted PurR-regulated permease PerM
MVVVSFLNAVFSTLLLTVVGVPYALVIGVAALFITLIGTILMTVVMTIVALFTSPIAALVVPAAMLVYMQVEAYLLTPKVMGRAKKVPGTVALIAAVAGATLLGLVGAFVAIPVAAGILLVLRDVVMPRKALS